MLARQNSLSWLQSIAAWTCSSVMPSLSISSRAASRHFCVIFGGRFPFSVMRLARCSQRRSASARGFAGTSLTSTGVLPVGSINTSEISGPADFAGVGLTCGSVGGSGRFCRGADFAGVGWSGRFCRGGPADFAGVRRSSYRLLPPLRGVTDSSPRRSSSFTASLTLRSLSRVFRASSATLISASAPLSDSSAMASRTISEPFAAREFAHAHCVAALAIHVVHFS